MHCLCIKAYIKEKTPLKSVIAFKGEKNLFLFFYADRLSGFGKVALEFDILIVIRVNHVHRIGVFHRDGEIACHDSVGAGGIGIIAAVDVDVAQAVANYGIGIRSNFTRPGTCKRVGLCFNLFGIGYIFYRSVIRHYDHRVAI